MIGAADIYVLAGLIVTRQAWKFRDLAAELYVSVAFAQRSITRAQTARLYLAHSRQVHRANFEEFAIHGLRFIAPGKLGEIVPGVPAAWATPPVAELIRSSGDEPPPVWPDASGHVRGQALEPLHPSAPRAAAESTGLRELLAILDSLRAGDVRVRAVSSDLLHDRLFATPERA